MSIFYMYVGDTPTPHRLPARSRMLLHPALLHRRVPTAGKGAKDVIIVLRKQSVRSSAYGNLKIAPKSIFILKARCAMLWHIDDVYNNKKWLLWQSFLSSVFVGNFRIFLNFSISFFTSIFYLFRNFYTMFMVIPSYTILVDFITEFNDFF